MPPAGSSHCGSLAQPRRNGRNGLKPLPDSRSTVSREDAANELKWRTLTKLYNACLQWLATPTQIRAVLKIPR